MFLYIMAIFPMSGQESFWSGALNELLFISWNLFDVS